MKVLGDDVEEGGDGPFDALLITATAMSLMALLVVLALSYGSGGNMGDVNRRSDDRRNGSTMSSSKGLRWLAESQVHRSSHHLERQEASCHFAQYPRRGS